MTITSDNKRLTHYKIQKTSFGPRSGDRKKETATGPCENKDTYWNYILHVVTQC